MTQSYGIIPFRKKKDISEIINKTLGIVCISLNLACIAISLLSLGFILLTC